MPLRLLSVVERISGLVFTSADITLQVSRVTLASLCLSLSSGAFASSTAISHDKMDAIADEFVQVGLRFQNHDPLPYLYIGPEAWRTKAREDDMSLAEVLAALNDLNNSIQALPPTTDGQDLRRRRDLTARLVALQTRGNILQGIYPKDFDDETLKQFGTIAPRYQEAQFLEWVAELDALLPGDAPLSERVAALRNQFMIPQDKIKDVIGRAMQECRSRSNAKIKLPANESVTLNITNNMPWVGFTEYKGDSQSIVHLNASVPVHIERAIELGCHEGYPGHHVHATLVEQEFVKNRGWNEYTYIPLVGPLAVIAEGAASFAMDIAFSREERIAFERDVLLPMAGLDDEKLDTYYHYIDLVEKLNYARNEAARQYLYQGMTRDDAKRWLMKFGLETEGTAATRMNIIDAQRSYVITYNYGRTLVADYIHNKTPLGTPAAWDYFSNILTTPLSPQDILIKDAN